MGLYNALDILSTITEALVFYVMTLCFCKICRFQKAVSRVLPPVLFGAAVIVLTFWVDIGAYRIFVILALMAGLVLLCYRTSFYRALTVMESPICSSRPSPSQSDSP